MIKKREIQKRIESKRAGRKINQKNTKRINQISKQRGSDMVYQLFTTIIHFFPELFDKIREIEDYRKGADYKLVELITACIGMFLLKEGSRNAFNNDRQEEKFKRNYSRMFKMRLPHMDTVDAVMRRLDENELEHLKTTMIRTLLVKKTLHKFRFQGKYFLVAVDGSGVASYSKKHCDHCLTKTSKNGKTTWFHNVLEAKLVCSNGFSISLGTEWIENPEGDYKKQDCEQKAFRRLAQKLKELFPQLPICIAADGLYPNQTFFSICKNSNWSFIVTFEDGNLPTVWKTVEVLRGITSDNKFSCTIKQQGKTISRDYCWLNGIDYRRFLINWIECVETVETDKSKKSSRFVHITDHKISRDTAEEISFSGRLRWKIENEGFNTQKNLGYGLKHKYSRVNWLAAKNYYQCLQIAHLINQLLELNTRFKEQLKGKITIKHLWKCMIGFLIYGSIDTEKLSILAQLRTQVRFE